MNDRWTRVVALAVAATLSRTVEAQLTSPGDYELLTGEDLAGSGFVVRHQQQLWGVTSVHQFDGRVPSRLLQLVGQPEEILLRSQGALRQGDVQAVPLQDQKLTVPFLAYQSDFALADGAALVVLGPVGETGSATLRATGGYRSSQGPRKLTAYTEKAFVASGGSGAPVVAAATDTVVGVLLSADDGEKARRLEFETLCLPGVEAEESGPVTFATAAGRWTLDLAYANDLWKEEKGAAYDAAEWERLINKPETIDVDEVRLDEKSVAFWRRGAENVRHSVLGWTVENGIVWVRARHPMGIKLTLGFVVRGGQLRLVDRDGTWRWMSAFRRAEPSGAHTPKAARAAGLALRLAAVAVLALGASLIAWLAGRLTKRRLPPAS